MKNYLFVLGRDPELSKIEIESYFEAKNEEYQILDSNDSIISIKLKDLKPEVIHELGGTVKIAEVISATLRPDEIEQNLEKYDIYKGTSNKTEYYVTGYNTGILEIVEDYLKDYFKRIKVKATHRHEGEPTKLIKKEYKEKIVDVVVFKNQVGVTVGVTDVIEQKERDLGRPNVDYMKVISIRLAKILVNLSKAKPGNTILDPFCGSGTILQESMLRGINVIGMDIDKGAIKQTTENLEWLKTKYGIKTSYVLYNKNSRDTSKFVKTMINGVVTEPYMGPYIRKLPNIMQARETIEELREIYSNLLNEVYSILKPGSRIAIVVPRLKTLEGKSVAMDFENMAKEHKYSLAYRPVLYGSNKNKLGREIYVLERN